MKKTTAVLIICAILIISLNGCIEIGKPSQPESTTAPAEYVTDSRGKLVPSYEDVDRTDIDVSLFETDERGRMYYGNPDVKTYTGIDVSVFQGDIDWQAVKADGIDFVMLRAGFRGYGSGSLNADDKFAENCRGAKDAGLEVGAYFFSQAINAVEAAEEAEFVLSVVKEYELSYPIAYDWEHIDYDTARTDEMSGDEITECANAFCSVIENAGYEAIIYFNCELGYFNYNLSRISGYHFWLAEYFDKPSFLYDYKIWQYTKTGAVDGIEGSVDINISLKDYSKPPVG